jgi:hypothetical protein
MKCPQHPITILRNGSAARKCSNIERRHFVKEHKNMAIYILEGVLVKLNPGLPWQKLNLTRRRIFLPVNWT